MIDLLKINKLRDGFSWKIIVEGLHKFSLKSLKHSHVIFP